MRKNKKIGAGETQCLIVPEGSRLQGTGRSWMAETRKQRGFFDDWGGRGEREPCVLRVRSREGRRFQGSASNGSKEASVVKLI